MPRPEKGFAAARLFRWQMEPVSQEYQHELALEPLSRKDGALLRPVSVLAGELGHWHRGVDLACPVGTPIRLVLSGTIVVPPYDPAGFGYSVQCRGTRYLTTYGHLSVVRVKEGVRRVHGDLVGLSGSSGNSTGPHVHFEVFDLDLMTWIDPWSVV